MLYIFDKISENGIVVQLFYIFFSEKAVPFFFSIIMKLKDNK